MDERIRSFDQGNPLVPLALGLVSWSEKLDELLEPQIGEADSAALLPQEDPAMLLLLGLLSVRRTLFRWLDEAAPSDSSEARTVASQSSVLPRDLSR
jgi:hypothetical protein